MTKTTIKKGVVINISGTRADLQITPRYPLESVRVLDNTDGSKGTNNKPHAHVKPSFLKKLLGK